MTGLGLGAVWHTLEERDTAFLVFDLPQMKRRVDALQAAFPVGFQHAVAIKTNPHPAVLSFLLKSGCGLEAASREELRLALEAGATGSQLIFDSPVKTREEIRWCIANLPGLMLNVNSLEELERIPPGHGLRVGIRINPLLSAAGDALYDVSTHRSKFGVPIEDEAAIRDACLAHEVTGLHMHVGSGAGGWESHVAAVERLLGLASRLDERLERAGQSPLGFINIGGGLSAQVGEAGMQQYGRAIAALRGPSARPWSTEFGHWVHAPCGSAYSKVEYVRGSTPNQPTMAFLHIGADLFTRQVYHKARSLKVSAFDANGAPKSGPLVEHTLVGPLCFAGDVLAESVQLPRLCEGDWVRIDEVGANTLGLWSRHCSRDVPKIFVQTLDGSLTCTQPRVRISH